MTSVRSAEFQLKCATCPATILRHFSNDGYIDILDAEAECRASSRWSTQEDPEGLCCTVCQATQMKAEKADSERRERAMNF